MVRVKICIICGQFYYKEEKVCEKCGDKNLRFITDLEIKCGFNTFEIKGSF